MSKDTKKATTEEDQELADLLDSALEDFDKTKDKSNEPSKAIEKSKKDESEEAVDVEWSDEFIKQAAQQFESNISNILKDVGGPELTPMQVQQSFQKMAEAAAQATTNPIEDLDADFSNSIAQALRGLSEGRENLQNPISENDLMNMFGQNEGDQNAFLPFMQGMMQSLLSKEVLYPSLKDILEKFPTWMEANGGSLTPEDRHKYEKQQELMSQVCTQLEKEPECETPEQKKVHFETILGLMQKLQDYGQPPTELVGDLGSGLKFDALGNPNLNECSLM